MCKTTKSAENCTFHAGCAVRIQYYLSLGKGEEGKRSVQAMYFTSLAFDSPSHCNEPAPINFIISSPLTLVRQIEVSHRVIGGKCVTIIHLIIVVPPTFQVFLGIGRKEAAVWRRERRMFSRVQFGLSVLQFQSQDDNFCCERNNMFPIKRWACDL